MARTILLTGGAGYIGSHTYVALIEAGYDVVIIDNFDNSSRSVLDRLARLTGQNRVKCHEGSVLDRAFVADVFDQYDFDGVVHFAAKKAVGESVRLPLDYVDTNVTGLLSILAAMDARDVRKLVFSSSATVHGDPPVIPITEDLPLNYTNPYSFTKVVSEQILEQATHANADWAFGILRYFNPVGAHPSGLIGEDPFDIPNNLMPYIAKVAAGELPHLTVFGTDYDTPDGTGVRDYIHVQDLARGHVLSLDALFRQDEGHTVNIGTGNGVSVLEMLAAYSAACGRELPREFGPRRDGDVATLLADPSRARALLGFEAQHSLDDMCTSSWNWINTGAKEA
ncbi:MAG: UDP-glucose 4-epimerase GalE [Pseudomonadota bacterium]